jgi:hypothetical protein
MATFPFLSDEWVAEARRIREDYRGRTAPLAHAVGINLVVTDVPFGAGSVDAHVDTSSGEIEVDLGHLPAADLTLTLGYDVARQILIDQDPQAATTAFFGGHIKLDGDLAKLLLLQGQLATVDDAAAEAAERIRSITEDSPAPGAPGGR